MSNVDSERGRKRGVESGAESVIILKPVEIEIFLTRGHLTGIIKEGCVQEAIDHDSPLRLQQQAVLIAEAPALEAAQVRSPAKGRQREERNLLPVFLPRRRRKTAERDHPALAQDRNVLNGLVIDSPKPELGVGIGVVVRG